MADLGFNFTNVNTNWHQLKACTAQIAQYGIRILAICSCGGISQICQLHRVCDAGALRAEPLGHPLYLARSLGFLRVESVKFHLRKSYILIRRRGALCAARRALRLAGRQDLRTDLWEPPEVSSKAAAHCTWQVRGRRIFHNSVARRRHGTGAHLTSISYLLDKPADPTILSLTPDGRAESDGQKAHQ